MSYINLELFSSHPYCRNVLLGIVFGALRSDGSVNKEQMNHIRGVTTGMLLTFHRAIDTCPQSNIEQHIEEIIEIGCDRILTSGGRESAALGADVLKRMVNCAAGRINIVAAAGVGAQSVQEIIEKTGVHGVHAGSGVTEVVAVVCDGEDDKLDMSSWSRVSSTKVSALVEAAGIGCFNFTHSKTVSTNAEFSSEASFEFVPEHDS